MDIIIKIILWFIISIAFAILSGQKIVHTSDIVRMNIDEKYYKQRVDSGAKLVVAFNIISAILIYFL